MSIERIKLTGLSTTPSDHDCQDGELSLAINALDEGGGLTALSGPKTVLEGYEVVFIHKNVGTTHFIILHNNNLFWCDEGATPDVTEEPENIHWINKNDSGTYNGITELNSIGNVLIVRDSHGLHMFRWKSGEYLPIPPEFPNIDIQFGLSGQINSTLIENCGLEETDSSSENSWDVVGYLSAIPGSGTYQNPVDVSSITFVAGKTYRIVGYVNLGQWQFSYLIFKDNDDNEMRVAMEGSQYGYLFIKQTTNAELDGKNYWFSFEVPNVGGSYRLVAIELHSPMPRRSTIPSVEILNTQASTSILEKSKDNHDILMGHAVAYIGKQTEAGNFIYPFFVRYALRTFDGHVVSASAPCLMMPCEQQNPIILWKPKAVGGQVEGNNLIIASCPAELRWKILSDVSTLYDSWGDIIQDIAIYATAPTYTFDEGAGFIEGKVQWPTRVVTPGSFSGYDCMMQLSDSQGLLKNDGKYLKYSMLNEILEGLNLEEAVQISQSVEAYNKDILDKIKNNITFYEIASISLKELSDLSSVSPIRTELTKIEIKKDLRNIVTFPTLDDSTYISDTRTISPEHMFLYNRRMHFYGGTEKLKLNIHAELLNGYCQNTYWDTTVSEYTYYIKAHIETEEGVKYLISHLDAYTGQECLKFLYLPDNRTKSCDILRIKRIPEGGDEYSYEYDIYRNVELEKYGINGMFYICPQDLAWLLLPVDDDIQSVIEEFSVENEETTSMKNKLYVSDVNNPWYIPASNVHTFGNGYILGINSAVKQLTEGGFGENPLYVFTSDEGIWALKLNEEGVYIKNQPVTREIATSHDGIVSLDDAVAFITARGIKIISGVDVKSLTDKLDMNVIPFGHMSQLVTFLGKQFNAEFIKASLACDVNDIPTGDYDENLYYQFIEGARLLYDYNNKRLYVFNTDTEVRNGVVTRKYPFNMVLSLSTFLWAMDTYPLDSAINSYPEAYAMFGGNLVEVGAYKGLYEVVAGENFIYDIPWLALTRPIKFEAPDMYKTIDSLMLRGHFKTEPARRGPMSPTPVVHYPSLALYGSNDLYNWHVVSSGTKNKIVNYSGTPYRYYRVLAFGRMLPKMHTVSWLEADVNVRLNNKLR